MRTILAAAATLALLVPAAARAQQDQRDYTQGPPPLEAEFRNPATEPISRKAFDQAVERLFRAGDGNRDGTITLAELNAAIEAHKTRVISERFAAVDDDGDKALSFAEFSAWQRSIGSAVLDEAVSGGQPLGELVAEEVRVDLGNDRKDRALERLLDPLNSVLLATANTDYDAGVSLAELVAFEGRKFDQFDANKDGWLTVDELDRLFPRPGG